MSVPPSNFKTIETSKERVKKEGDNSNLELSQLYKEGKEFTYLVSVSGTTNEHVLDVSPGFKNIVSAEVVQSHIPFTEYNIEEDRNTIDYKVVDELGSYTGKIVLPIGNYTADSLISAIHKIASREYSPLNQELTTLAQGTGSTINGKAVRLRLGEEADTGRFFFYTLDDSEDETFGDGLSFNIEKTSTALYPLGLSRSEQQYNSSGEKNIRTTSGNLATDSYGNAVFCENRYDLSSTSDPLTITCKEIDREVKRGYNDNSVIPLAEIFLGTVGSMDLNQKLLPDRPINPPLTLNRLTLNFNRPDRSNNNNNLRPYKFRGVRWYLKLAIKTLEMPSSIEAINKAPDTHDDHDDLEELTKGFGNQKTHSARNSQRQLVFQGPKQGVSSSMSSMSNEGGVVILPLAYNSGRFGEV